MTEKDYKRCARHSRSDALGVYTYIECSQNDMIQDKDWDYVNYTTGKEVMPHSGMDGFIRDRHLWELVHGPSFNDGEKPHNIRSYIEAKVDRTSLA